MGRPIEIKLDAETTSAERNLDSTADSLDKVADSLDDVEAASRETARRMDDVADAGADVERGLKDAKDAADDAARVLDRDLTKALDDVETQAKRTGTSVGDDTERGFRRAGEATETFRDEAKSNLSETVSSFRGDIEDVAQVAQDVLGGVVADLGPWGAAIGAAGAAGIGLTIAALQQGAEEAESTKQRILDLADAIREANGDVSALDWGELIREWGNEYDDVKSWFEPWQKASVTNFEAMEDAARKYGLTYSSLVQGMAGDSDAGRDALEELNAEIERQQEVVDNLAVATGGLNTAHGQANSAEQGRLKDLKDLKRDLEDATGLTEEAIEHEQRMADALRGTQAELDAHNEALREKNDLTRESITADLDFEDALASLTGTAEDWTATLDKNTQQGRDNQRTILDTVGDLQALADTTLEQTGSQEQANRVLDEGRLRLLDQAAAAGYNRDEVDRLIRSILTMPATRSTDLRVGIPNFHGVEADMAWLARAREVSLRAVADRYQWQRTVTNEINGLHVPAIVVQARLGQAAL